MSEETTEDAKMVTVFESPEALTEFFAMLGLDDIDPAAVVQADGSIVLAIADRAITLEHHEAVAGVVITALIARAAGPELDGIVHDLMALNARPHTTGGLIFGILDDDILVGSLILSDTIASPRTVAETLEAVVESTDAWRTLIEQAGDATRSIANRPAEDMPSQVLPATLV